MATSSMRKNTKDATRRAAGPPGHARGPTTPPFLVGSQGAVAVRWVSDPQPAYDPGATGERYVTLWTLRGTMAPPRRVALPGGPLRGRLLTLGRVATRSDSWSVLAFGAKWIISGRLAC